MAQFKAGDIVRLQMSKLNPHITGTFKNFLETHSFKVEGLSWANLSPETKSLADAYYDITPTEGVFPSESGGWVKNNSAIAADFQLYLAPRMRIDLKEESI